MKGNEMEQFLKSFVDSEGSLKRLPYLGRRLLLTLTVLLICHLGILLGTVGILVTHSIALFSEIYFKYKLIKQRVRNMGYDVQYSGLWTFSSFIPFVNLITESMLLFIKPKE